MSQYRKARVSLVSRACGVALSICVTAIAPSAARSADGGTLGPATGPALAEGLSLLRAAAAANLAFDNVTATFTITLRNALEAEDVDAVAATHKRWKYVGPLANEMEARVREFDLAFGKLASQPVTLKAVRHFEGVVGTRRLFNLTETQIDVPGAPGPVTAKYICDGKVGMDFDSYSSNAIIEAIEPNSRIQGMVYAIQPMRTWMVMPYQVQEKPEQAQIVGHSQVESHDAIIVWSKAQETRFLCVIVPAFNNACVETILWNANGDRLIARRGGAKYTEIAPGQWRPQEDRWTDCARPPSQRLPVDAFALDQAITISKVSAVNARDVSFEPVAPKEARSVDDRVKGVRTKRELQLGTAKPGEEPDDATIDAVIKELQRRNALPAKK